MDHPIEGGTLHLEGGKLRPEVVNRALKAASHYVLRAAFDGRNSAPQKRFGISELSEMVVTPLETLRFVSVPADCRT